MTSIENSYTSETVTAVHEWVPGKLFSFTCTRPKGFRFTAGQFARLGVDNTMSLPNEPRIIWRAYSMVSSPYEELLEFFSIVVPDGAFTSHLSRVQVGQSIYVDKTNFGFLTTARFESGRHLWLLGSGTGLAPFLSIVHDPATWEQFERVILVHCARTAQELVYQERIQHFTQHPVFGELVSDLAKRFTYVPVVTREQVPYALGERITTLLKNGSLEHHSGLKLTPEHSRFMICGNPEMVRDVRQQLKHMGFAPARRSAPGAIAVENYW